MGVGGEDFLEEVTFKLSPERMTRSSLGECHGRNVFQEEKTLCAKAQSGEKADGTQVTSGCWCG